MHQSPEEAANQSSFDPEKGSSSNLPTAIESGQASNPKPRGKESVYKGLGWLDRLLALWILLAIIIGILIGNYVDGAEAALQKGKFVQVSVPIAVGLLVMMYPILCKVQYETLHLVFQKRAIWIQLGFSILMNWIACAKVEYSVVATSVGVFLGIPLGAAIVTRFAIRALSARWYQDVFLKWIAPWSLIGLLYTILVLFASQGRNVVHQIVSVVRVAAPLIVYFFAIFSFTLFVTHKLGFGYKLAATQSFTAASNNFELAIAIAVATYGPNSDQALATTVGPLVEVPVLLALVYLVKSVARQREWKD
ncbi:hypothetical protein B0A48_18778 [Cryoendolithus antarcticus]|uniref:Arsenical-resistance protein n=1 Tax=Cryoendolithus antarcticus TaxID=1507870 RepID=A0A1V8S7J9_9PEZI|nr:hypothetical protein B0A48_18778 [Cryoendolithus antarcticus]